MGWNPGSTVECRIERSSLQWQRVLVGLLVSAVGMVIAFGVIHDGFSRGMAMVVVLGLSWFIDGRIREGMRYGYSLGVSETHVRVANGQPLEAFALSEVEEVVRRDEKGYFLVLKTGGEIPLPMGSALDPAYRALLTRVPNRLGDPASFSQ